MTGYKVTYCAASDSGSSYWRVKNLQTGKSVRVGYDHSADNPRRAAVESVAGSSVVFIGNHSRGAYFVAM